GNLYVGYRSTDGPIVSSDVPLDQNSIHRVKTLYIPDPLSGNYNVKVIGTGIGSYAVTSVIYDNNGDSKTENLYGNTLLNLSADYNLNFNSSSSQNTAFVPVDTAPPVIFHTQINKDYVLNSNSILFEFSARDAGVGVFRLEATLSGQPITNEQSIIFNEIGSFEIKIVAEDYVGNITTEVIDFDVIYNFSGYLSPIKNDGTGIYKLGRTLPVKFQLTDVNGAFITNAAAHLFVAKISNGVVETEEMPLSTFAADTGNLFRYDPIDNQYIFNLNTSSLSQGAWRLRVDLGDGTTNTVLIFLR
ncbi:MAG: PxKF domain-containing protein, partial [Patescibacteria group bacterium]